MRLTGATSKKVVLVVVVVRVGILVELPRARRVGVEAANFGMLITQTVVKNTVLK